MLTLKFYSFLSLPRRRGCHKSLTVGDAHPTFIGKYCELALLVGWALPTKLLLRHPQERGNEKTFTFPLRVDKSRKQLLHHQG